MIQIFFDWLVPRPPPHKKKQPKISLLIPFSSHSHAREDTFRWLLEYWKHELPEAEIVIGHSHGKIFSKGMALNDAASKAKGKVLVILDADAYMSGEVINTCADRILEELDHHLWYVPYRHLYRLTNEITKKIRKSDPSDPLRIPSPPPLEYIDGHSRDRSGYGHRFAAMIAIMPREALDILGCFDERFHGWGCTDEKTEILTNTGWKHYSNLSVGDSVLTLNHNTGLSEWQQVQKVNVFDGHHEMILSESRTHSSFTTLNHRWPVILRDGKRSWRTSETIGYHDRIPVAAECADLPTAKKYNDDLVSLVGWFCTEGHIRSSLSGGVVIAQSKSVHPDNYAMIEESLIRIFGPEGHISTGKYIHGKYIRGNTVPYWKRYVDQFALNKAAGQMLQDLAPGKVPSFEFLLSLTKTQLELFIKTSMLGDGSASDRTLGAGTMEQKNPLFTEAFAFALILSGKGVSINKRRTLAKRTRFEYSMSKVEMQLGKLRGLVPAPRKTPRGIDGTFERKTLDGVVWCPTTPNSTWLARRNGKIYFTGNSEDIAMLRSLDTLYGLHKTTNNDILHLWHPFFGQSYRTRVWKGQDASDGGSNNKLASEYNKATGHPAKMRKLVDEGCALIKQHRNKE